MLTNLFNNAREIYFDPDDRDDEGNPILPPPLHDDWLSPEEQRERQHRRREAAERRRHLPTREQREPPPAADPVLPAPDPEPPPPANEGAQAPEGDDFPVPEDNTLFTDDPPAETATTPRKTSRYGRSTRSWRHGRHHGYERRGYAATTGSEPSCADSKMPPRLYAYMFILSFLSSYQKCASEARLCLRRTVVFWYLQLSFHILSDFTSCSIKPTVSRVCS